MLVYSQNINHLDTNKITIVVYDRKISIKRTIQIDNEIQCPLTYFIALYLGSYFTQ